MARIALITVSDGRPSVHSGVGPFAKNVEEEIAVVLEQMGNQVIRAADIVHTSDLAVSEARRLAFEHSDLTIVNIPVWAFPHFTVLIADQSPGPLLLFSNVDPQFPGMVGMLAAAGGLDQIGRVYERAWGNINDRSVATRVDRIARAAKAVKRLRGATFGRIGGRPMGMYTAVANVDQWIKQFGVDIEEIDQWEVVRRADAVSPELSRMGREWLELHCAGVHYDERRLTPELLELQIRSYHAVREIIRDWNIDFCGIKGQPELTEHFCSMDIAEAFLNDPYDWEGAKAPTICSTEADMDGALTMQILHRLSDTPVLFADLRCYDAEIWDLGSL